MKYPADFFREVNEVYHDVEGREKENKHGEIFVDEANQWREIGLQFVANGSGKITLLDNRLGYSFVPLKITDLLKENDSCVYSDVSSNMLHICKENLSHKNCKCRFTYIKREGKEIGFESNYFSHITPNSVLYNIAVFQRSFMKLADCRKFRAG